MDLFDLHPEVFEAVCAFVRKCGGDPANVGPTEERELEAALYPVTQSCPVMVERPDCSALVVEYDD